jgi:formate/nitrite transporter
MTGYYNSREVVENYIAGCRAKAQTSSVKLILKAVMAGMMIAMGAGISSVAAHSVGNVGLARLAAAVVFPMGLMMVILLGTELFTGDCLFVMSVFDRKQTVWQYTRLLCLVYIGNFIGAGFLALLISMSGQWDYSSGMLGAYTIKVAVGKVNVSFVEGIVSGVLCNILVCAAVLMAMCAKDVAGRLFASFFVIMLFVTGGFEHCVANMYYITAGLIAKTDPVYSALAMEAYGYSEAYLGTLNIANFLIKNLLPVTIGNIVGGAFCLGAPMYYLNREKKKD